MKASPKVKERKMKMAADRYGVWLSIVSAKDKTGSELKFYRKLRTGAITFVIILTLLTLTASVGTLAVARFLKANAVILALGFTFLSSLQFTCYTLFSNDLLCVLVSVLWSSILLVDC